MMNEQISFLDLYHPDPQDKIRRTSAPMPVGIIDEHPTMTWLRRHGLLIRLRDILEARVTWRLIEDC